MDKNQLQIGQIVTWGSGRPRGKIVEINTSYIDFPIIVELICESTGACGRAFPKGSSASFPAGELRPVQ